MTDLAVITRKITNALIMRMGIIRCIVGVYKNNHFKIVERVKL